MPAGRPRTSIPEKEELIALGEDLLAWAREKPDDELRCRWCEWYAKKHMIIRAQWKRMLDTPEFRPYYEAAQPFLAERWLQGPIHHSISHRYIRIYDPELREEENKDEDAKETRKAVALKGEVRAIEQEKIKILEEVLRQKRIPQQ